VHGLTGCTVCALDFFLLRENLEGDGGQVGVRFVDAIGLDNESVSDELYFRSLRCGGQRTEVRLEAK
jgi:hypothetical protein